MNLGRKTHTGPTSALPGQLQPPQHSRRNFLRVAALGLAGLAAANSGCIIMPPIAQAINATRKGDFQNLLLQNGFRPLAPSAVQKLRKDVRLILKNATLLQPEEKRRANDLIREWVALSDFTKPCFSEYCSGNESEIRERVRFLGNGIGSGSGTIVTSEGHVLTAAHVIRHLGASSFSKATIAGDLDLAMVKLSENIPEIRYYPRALAKLAATKPASSASVMMYGYPANTGASLGGLQEVKSAVMFQDDSLGIMLISPIAQAVSGSGRGAFEFYGDGIADLRGLSGGPVTTGDGRIVAVFSKVSIKGSGGSNMNAVLAPDTDCIRETVFRYINEHLAGPIQELAMNIKLRLG